MRKIFFVFLFVSIVGIPALALVWSSAWWLFVLVGPFIIIGIYDIVQKKHALMRNFPIVGHGRYIMETLRPKIYQYFIESDIDGRPFSRIFRSIVYKRAKHELDTNPFGTQLNVYRDGYEWLNHSLNALNVDTLDMDPRIWVGGKNCSQPYSCSVLNVSAMSYGSLSKNAILALNGGAQLGKFAHNTGEGGIASYHLKYKGDLIYQIGTGYFGCRNEHGDFSPEKFKETIAPSSVKMIELKLSQGAKPGHGGILPGIKNTPEIASIRGVQPGKPVLSPPTHTAFTTPFELLGFVQNLRELSGGKPVGFKLCIGRQSEFLAICKAMVEKDLYPDFITIDGGEGGTGAAPLEFSNAVGMPFLEALAFAYDSLVGFGLKKEIKLFGSGKIITGFHIYRALALGADACYSARGMMMSLGCIQALECNLNTCPTGITTQNPSRMIGLVVDEKILRVTNFHRETIESFVELIAASGIEDPSKINRSQIYRRVPDGTIKRYDEIFPYTSNSSLLSTAHPDYMKIHLDEADPSSFKPHEMIKKYH